MRRILAAASLVALAACDGNPIAQGGGVTPEDTCAGSQVCTGEVNRFTYDSVNDRIRINNLPFDLDGTYLRTPSLDRGAFRAYVNEAGDEDYVALYRQSGTGSTYAGVVGTGGYLGFGYGGTVFGGSGSVNFPGNGEAVYRGQYAGIRVYDGGGLGFSDGTIRMRVDFEDFDNVGAIDTIVSGRRGYDENGNLLGTLPTLSGTTTGFTGDRLTETSILENLGGGNTGASGTLNGTFGGSGATEVAGVIVIEGDDALGSGLQVRESGAFTANRISFIRP